MNIAQGLVKDYKPIINFIKKNWIYDHILTKNKKLFDYFYKKKKN